MSAGRYDITLEGGATFDLPIRWTDSSGTPVSLVGYSAHMQVREAPGSTVRLEFTSNLTSSGFIFLAGPAERREDGANGNLRIFMSSANTSGLGRFSGRYDLELHNSEGYTTRLLEGQFRIEPEITA
jgi:hypothetical protein